MVARALARHLGGRGRIIELEGIPDTSAPQESGKGFNDALREYPDIQVAGREVADFDRHRAAEIMHRLLQKKCSLQNAAAVERAAGRLCRCHS